MGGFRLPENSDSSRLGEESRDEGLEERERGEMGPGWRLLGLSSETSHVKSWDVIRFFSFINLVLLPWLQIWQTCGDDERQGWDRCWFGDLPTAGKPLLVWRLQLVAEASRSRWFLGRWVFSPGAVAPNPDPPKVRHDHLSYRYYKVKHTRRITQVEIWGKTGQRLKAPSSSVDRAKRGIVSKLWVLVITRGLVLLSDWEELEEARGRRL